GRMIDNALARAITSGKVGFDDLKKVALSAMTEIAQASLRALFQSPGGGGTGSSLINGLSSLVASLFGDACRATGGPVTAGRGYRSDARQKVRSTSLDNRFSAGDGGERRYDSRRARAQRPMRIPAHGRSRRPDL